MHDYILIYSRLGKSMSSVFSTDGPLISASAVPHCGRKDERQTDRDRDKVCVWSGPKRIGEGGGWSKPVCTWWTEAVKKQKRYRFNSVWENANVKDFAKTGNTSHIYPKHTLRYLMLMIMSMIQQSHRKSELKWTMFVALRGKIPPSPPLPPVVCQVIRKSECCCKCMPTLLYLVQLLLIVNQHTRFDCREISGTVDIEYIKI